MNEDQPALFDKGLQPERTALAWRRTGLALTVATLVAVRILPEVLGAWAIVPAGFGLAAAAIVLTFAHRRDVHVRRLLVRSDSDRVPLSSALLPFLVTVLVTGGGVAALTVVLWSAHAAPSRG